MAQEVAQKSDLDAFLINAVVESTKQVLGTMASTQAECKQVKADTSYRPYGDISAMINITGENGEGMFALSFPVSLANMIVSRLLGTSPDKISSDDRCDGVGELVNMISGGAKSTLSQQSNQVYKLSLPTVIQGNDHSITSQPKNAPFIVVEFETEGQLFSLQICFKAD